MSARWVAFVVSLAAAGPVAAQDHPTTSYRTIAGDPDAPYSTLRFGPGWKRVVREDLAEAQRGRSVRRRTISYFAQLSDFQLADEESPARVETLDQDSSPFTSAWRPQEALVPHLTDFGIRAVNEFAGRSPLRSQTRCVRRGKRVRGCLRRRFAKMDFAITTGDNADNQQRNEVRWVVQLLEGGPLTPNSGVEDPAPCPAGPVPAGEAALYTGVQDVDDVIDSGDFYDPDVPGGRFAAFPRWPGLMDRAQQPFTAAGLKVPSYVSFGNHDGVVQGNVAANAGYEAVVVGCVKPLSSRLPGFGALLTAPDRSFAVPRDPDRTFVSRKDYMALHRTGRQADAHGFGLVDPQEASASGGQASYYEFRPRPGLRMISINTVGEGSNVPGSQGNLDEPQFRWLERRLEAADDARELVIVFGHHPIRSLSNPDPDEDAGSCSNPVSGPGCDGDPRPSTPIRQGADLQALLLAHPSVVAFVAGHTHEHKVTPFKRADGKGGFWGVETASHVDWPIQSRLLELMDNGDGTLSLFGTVIDHAQPLRTPPPGTDAKVFDVETLAVIGRELSFNDPQAGGPGGEGKPEDRNVELLIREPFRLRGSRARRSGDVTQGGSAPRP